MQFAKEYSVGRWLLEVVDGVMGLVLMMNVGVGDGMCWWVRLGSGSGVSASDIFDIFLITFDIVTFLRLLF